MAFSSSSRPAMSRPKSKASSKPRPGALSKHLESKPEPNVMKSRLKPNETPQAREAEYTVEGLAMNAVVGVAFSGRLAHLDRTECFAQVLRNAQVTASGDRKSQQSILAAQVVSTNAIYTDLAILARNNLEKGLEVFERLMRLALKAQSNCRATAETLALMQNPPTVFAKQANISNGPQQVNNGIPPPDRVARAKKSDSLPNKLLESHGEKLDRGTPSAAGHGDTQLAPLGTLNRPTKPRR